MMKLAWGLLAGALLLIPACDQVRFPGDGRDSEYKPDIPEGAPGPAPPSEPVDDPYGNGTETPPEAGTDTGTETPVETSGDTGETDTTIPVDTGATDPDTDTVPDSGTDTGGDDGGVTPVDTDPVEPDPEPVVVFSYVEPGQLLPNSGMGALETEVIFSPDMQFPIKSAPAYPQSQVYNFGGGVGGDQCDERNYEYPWRDNFCETRSSTRSSPYCAATGIHQGQDIRVGTAAGCNELRGTPAAERDLYEVVAVEDGVVQSIGTYTVTQRSGPRIYKYMHMNMADLKVSSGDTVTKGQTLGFVSNDFGGTPTTFHLHFELLQNTEDGWVHVPPYTSLVAAYERREGGIGEQIEPNVGVASARPQLPEGYVIIE